MKSKNVLVKNDPYMKMCFDVTRIGQHKPSQVYSVPPGRLTAHGRVYCLGSLLSLPACMPQVGPTVGGKLDSTLKGMYKENDVEYDQLSYVL